MPTRTGDTPAPAARRATPLARESASGGTALLVLDMFSDWKFPDAESLLVRARAIAPRLARLRRRCKEAGIPIIYANDNLGRWQSDREQIVAAALRGAGAKICALLAPEDDDYFVLKPKHSAFYKTPLDLLLRHLGARRLIVGGVAADQCVLLTVADARMRDYEVVVARDGIASQSATRRKLGLRMLGVLEVETCTAARIHLPARTRSGRANSARGTLGRSRRSQMRATPRGP